MDLFSRIKPSLFIARPWDTSFAELYEPIIKSLSLWKIYDGSRIYKENIGEAKREMFVNRNKQLYELIVSGIQKSDVVIADVTNANPNVMIELGIAIQLNKNIIILTGQDRNRLPFDVQGFTIEKYGDSKELFEKICSGLDLYLSIKKQDFAKPFHENYTLFGDGKLTFNNSILQINLPKLIKNVKLRIEYKIINPSDKQDWLGIHLRASPLSVQPSELIYVRADGRLEVVNLPSTHKPKEGENKVNKNNESDNGFTRLEVTLDGSNLLAATSSKELFSDSIQLESFGDLWLQATAHNQDENERKKLEIEFRQLEIINIDTTVPNG